ncbi:kinase-like domain-containing protein [Tanacetum coccineum]
MKSPQEIICLSASSRVSFLFYGLAITCLTSTTFSASYGGNETDYLALLSFKSKITHDPYQVLASWNHSFHFCQWSGVSCGKRHKRVIALQLGSQGLEGSLSPHVGNLSFLRELYLRNNSFQETIPRELGRLSRLRRLYLDENKFSGVILANLSGCSNLEELVIGRNKLGGSIPKEMSLLSKLYLLVIEFNKLTGGIPPFLGNITSMEVFSVVENPLGGHIPDAFGLWKSLTGFGCGLCNLYGSIPHSIFNLSLLVNLSFYENHLTGTLPLEIGNQLPNLELLQLWGNKLTGVRPPSISNCSKLRLLEMANNSFSGKLTIDFSKLRDINIIHLYNNNFHGCGKADDIKLIDSLKNCTRLVDLDISNCNLIGVLPISIGNLSDQLSYLYLTDNELFGSLPSSIGPIPNAIGNLSLLTQLYLYSNELEGHIPSSLGNCKELNFLDLADNRLSGKIPKQILQLRSLTIGLVLYQNSLSGNASEINRLLTANLIGEGGFSSVYKGILDSDDDRFVAVKVLHLQNRGALKSNDFKALVYEFMPNGSVHDWLHSSAITSKLRQRITILKDVATPLDYPHIRCQTTIVHSDLKPSNILLDDDMVAHVGDFGLARLLGTDLNQNSSTGVKGTIGYAPLVWYRSEMTSSGDVYNFGILLLEVMTGKKPTDGMFNEGLSLHKFAYMALPDHAVDVIDNDAIVLQSTETNAKKVEECLAATIKIGVSCSVDSPPQRMKIEIVVNELQRILDVSLEFLDLSFNDFEGEVPIVGVFANTSAFSVLGNNKLCGGLVTLELPKCKEKGSKKTRFPFFIFVIVIVPTLLIVLCCVYLLCKKKRNSQPSQSSGNERFLKVSYNELLKATDGFTTENLIGEGGFSSVYKGILDSHDDRFVAIKVLHLQSRGAHRSFLAECEAWRNIRHRNLLKIITSCSSVDFQGNDFKALVYEYMPNGSVHDWLHSSANTSKLNLLQRINILRDVATALDYLHNRCQTTIVHGDLKPSNILLDDDMVAHVGDFGLARLLGTDLNQNSSTGVKGTIGYAPPEYGIGSEMTSSGDVYSFGILLLEVMTGKKPTDNMFNEGLSIHKFAYMALPDYLVDVIDNDAIVLQSTEANANKVEECLIATIKIGVSCSLDSPPQRMKIEIVVTELQRILDVLQNIYEV